MDASTLSACTSVIISGKCTADGRPLMWKNRDTDVLDNRLEHFSGKKYSFTALVNASSREADEVWIGMNDRGFAVMNTASYNLKDDDVPVSEMDREGILMYDALGECADVDDFEAFLDSRSRPMGVEANFGVIDSFGGAAYYEVSNDKWVKFDVNDATVCPEGYMVVTNFSRSGRPEDYRGYERYLTAEAIFREIFSFGEPCAVTPEMIFDELSRSYRSEMTGMDYGRDYERLADERIFNGTVPDMDFIPRRSTSASVVIHGTEAGGNPLNSVMWTILGYPLCSVAIPVPVVGKEEEIPYYMRMGDDDFRSAICSDALRIKNRFIFRFGISNGSGYLDLSPVFGGKKPFIRLCRDAEKEINDSFIQIYSNFVSGKISYEDYISSYLSISGSFYDIYRDKFGIFLPEES